MCCIYYAFTDKVLESTLNKHRQLVPEDLKNKLNNITDGATRINSLMSLIVVNKLLTDLKTGIDLHQLSYHNNGKPMLPNGYSISIAHSGNLVLCACCTNNLIGVDVENLENFSIQHFEDYLTPNEKIALSTAQDPNLVLKQMWVRKEAVLKADGIGLLYPLHELDVSLPTTQLHNNTYYLYNINIAPGYVAALATTQPHTGITVKEVSI